MDEENETPPPDSYPKFVIMQKNGENQIVEVDNPERRVAYLKVVVLDNNPDLGYDYLNNDVYYENNRLKDHEKVGEIFERFGISDGPTFVAIDKIWLKIARKGKQDAGLYAGVRWTVGEVKSELHEINDEFPAEFELRHPDQPGVNLDDDLSLAYVGVSVNSSAKLIAIGAVDRIMLKIARNDYDDDIYDEIYADVKWTVGELKTEIRKNVHEDVPDQFELRHPDQPDIDLDDDASLASVGVNEVSSKLIAIVPGSVIYRGDESESDD